MTRRGAIVAQARCVLRSPQSWRLGVLAALALAGCKSEDAAAESKAPTGEVAMTLDAIKQANIVVEPASEQEIDDTLVTSGRVTFEDIKVGHVFSPVTGRVLRIDVELGAKVKAGQPLAVI